MAADIAYVSQYTAIWRWVEIICTDEWWVGFMSPNRCILHSKL